jgi:diguanylate cyclase (GGDEF)-like protein/PAS domain S-box-containing protein
MRAVYRIAQDVDFAIDQDALSLLSHWRALKDARGRVPLALLQAPVLAAIRDNIEIMTPDGDGAFRYVHHGDELARAAGVKLGGRSTAEFRSDVAAFFLSSYGLAAESGEVVYAINESALVTPIHAWRRYHFPFHDDEGRVACIVGLVRPTMEQNRVWRAVSMTAGFGAGSLEPLRGPGGEVHDFMIIEAAGLAPLLFGRNPSTLGDLFGRVLEPPLVEALLTASIGERILSETIEVGSNDGRRDLLAQVHSSEIGLILNVRDVTEMTAAQQLIARRTAELKRAQILGRIAGWSMNLKEKTLYWSPEMIALLRLDPQTFKATPQSVNALYLEEDRKRAAEVQRRVLDTGVRASLDVSARRGDGTTGHYTLEFSADHAADGEVVGIFGTVQDITERKEAELMLEKLAYFDPLTGLPNRAMFKKELDHKVQAAVATGRSFHLMLMDLDNFKDVNDTLGHGAGDMLLVRVARMLRQAAPADALVARLGGDEFAILYQPHAGDPTVDRLANAIVMEAADPILLDDGEAHIGVSIGIAEGVKDGAAVAQLLKNADLALYSAKDAGRGRHHFYDPSMSGQAEDRISLGRDLKRALADDALDLHFQPIVALGSRTVVGFEALLRWRHPTRGYVPPAEFIPIAESSSLICDLGFWVLNRACRAMKAWIDAGNAPLVIAVNVSAVQFWQSSFETEVKDVLKSTGLPPELLKLEVTESVFVDSGNKRVRDCFHGLADIGVKLAIDDFGTGFSSLSYLSALPFSELKIDRSFVTGIDMAADRQKLLQGIVGLARGLNMSTIIEGAETLGEVLMLQGLGCNLVQGYFFARPQPFEAWPEMIASIEGAGETDAVGLDAVAAAS